MSILEDPRAEEDSDDESSDTLEWSVSTPDLEGTLNLYLDQSQCLIGSPQRSPHAYTGLKYQLQARQGVYLDMERGEGR